MIMNDLTKLKELKKVFDACREYRGHTIQQAGEAMEKPNDEADTGYSETTINRFFKDDLTYSDNIEQAVKGYIYQTQLVKAINELGLNPDVSKNKLANCKG